MQIRKVKEQSMDNYTLLAIDCDTCPEKDNIILQGQCGSCEYYKGFELYHSDRCVKCSYNTQEQDDSITE